MRMTAVIDPTGTVALDLEGETSTETHSSVMEARRSVMGTATAFAAETSTTTELHIEDPAGNRTVLVRPDGGIVDHTASDNQEEQPVQQQAQSTTTTVETPVTARATEQVDTPAADPEPSSEPEPTTASKRVSRRGSKATPAATEHVAEALAPVEVIDTAPTAGMVETPSVVDATRAMDSDARSTVADGETDTDLAPALVEREQVASVEAPPTRRTSMPSFVDRPDTASPAQLGVRGLLNQFGLKLSPSQDELGQREDEKLVSQHWAGPRTITVLNPKGGAGKTPTEVCLSAVFARLGGSGVLAWDNNSSLGSLGWRTYDAGHKATVVDLLGQTDYFMSAEAQVGDLASYVHHQPADQYDVLRSDARSDAKARHEVTGTEVHRLHAVAAKYYRLILMDSGNTERGDNWEAMISHTDQVVIPVKSVADAAEGASHVLNALRTGDEHTQALADRAVVIVLGADPAHGKAKLDKLADDFRPFVKAVTTVPYDPALVEGRIRFSAMLPGTRRAWLRAAALIAEEL